MQNRKCTAITEEKTMHAFFNFNKEINACVPKLIYLLVVFMQVSCDLLG